MAKTTTASTEITITALEQEDVTFCLLGLTPFYCNRVAEKAKRELLLPRLGRLTQAQKAENLKHNPEEEFRNSPYLQRVDGPTRILMKATAVKGAIGQTAIDMPTAVARAQINRLTYVVDEYIPIFGVPLLNMEIVRMQDQARTPDIRTRARIFPWATTVTIRYTKPMLDQAKISTLLSASGMICGIGDFRQEKGKGNNGLYQIVAYDDRRFVEVMKTGGRTIQDEYLATPICSDPETEDLLAWYHEELGRRSSEPKKEKEPKKTARRGNGKDQHQAV